MMEWGGEMCELLFLGLREERLQIRPPGYSTAGQLFSFLRRKLRFS